MWVFLGMVFVTAYLGSLVTSAILYRVFEDSNIEQSKKEITLTLVLISDDVSSVLVYFLSFWLRSAIA